MGPATTVIKSCIKSATSPVTGVPPLKITRSKVSEKIIPRMARESYTRENILLKKPAFSIIIWIR